jgi:hypothetical protein
MPDSLWQCQDNVCRVIERRGADVAVVEGFPPDKTVAMLESARHAKKAEFSPKPRPERDAPSPKK